MQDNDMQKGVLVLNSLFLKTLGTSLKQIFRKTCREETQKTRQKMQRNDRIKSEVFK